MSYWAKAVADVVVDGPPVNPPDGEQVVEVLVLPPEQAIAYLDANNDNVGVPGNIVRLAVAMGLV